MDEEKVVGMSKPNRKAKRESIERFMRRRNKPLVTEEVRNPFGVLSDKKTKYNKVMRRLGGQNYLTGKKEI